MSKNHFVAIRVPDFIYALNSLLCKFGTYGIAGVRSHNNYCWLEMKYSKQAKPLTYVLKMWLFFLVKHDFGIF